MKWQAQKQTNGENVNKKEKLTKIFLFDVAAKMGLPFPGGTRINRQCCGWCSGGIDIAILCLRKRIFLPREEGVENK